MTRASQAEQRRLRVLSGALAIVKADPARPWPDWLSGSLWSVSRTPTELSVVCDSAAVPAELAAERDWRALEVEGPIAFGEVGVLASLAVPLRDANVSIFAISTFDTDYVLVRQSDLQAAVESLESAGWIVERR